MFFPCRHLSCLSLLSPPDVVLSVHPFAALAPSCFFSDTEYYQITLISSLAPALFSPLLFSCMIPSALYCIMLYVAVKEFLLPPAIYLNKCLRSTLSSLWLLHYFLITSAYVYSSSAILINSHCQ